MKKIIFLCVPVLLVFSAFCQDAYFLNSNQSLISVNPSFAGSNGFLRNQFSYRNQWPSRGYGFVSYLNSFDAYIKPVKGGIAFSAYTDDRSNGTFKSSLYSVSYAQHLSLMENKLKIIPSLQFSYGRKSIASSWIIPSPGVPPDPVLLEKDYSDLSSGLLINYNRNLYLGATFFHINQPDIGFQGTDRLPGRWSLYASYNFVISEKNQIQLLYHHQGQLAFASNRLAVNMLNFNHLITGLAYEDFDRVAVNAGYRNNYFSIVLGYDLTYSRLAGNTADTWELHSSFNLRNKEQRKVLTAFESW